MDKGNAKLAAEGGGRAAEARRAPTSRDGGRVAWGIAQGAVLLALALVVFLPAIHGEFVLDDYLYLTRNPVVVGDGGLYGIWFTTQPIDFGPLSHSLFWAEWRLWNENPLGYHLVSIVLHAACAVVGWLALREIGVCWAWLAAAAFVLHPVNVECVAWISQQKTLLATLFGFAALAAFVRSQQPGESPAMFALAVAMYVLSLLSKQSMIMLPVFLVLYVAQRRGGWTWRDGRRLGMLFLAALVLGLVGWWFQQHRCLGHAVVRSEGFGARLAGAGSAIWFYLGKALAPWNLSVVYPRRGANPWSWSAYLPAALFLATVAAAWYVGRRRSWARWTAVALTYFAVMLFPVLGFFDVGMFKLSFVVDHYQYQSLLAIVALGAAALAVLGRRGPRWQRLAAAGLAGTLLLALAVLSGRQAGLWASNERLWRDAALKNPQSDTVWYELGRALQGRQDHAAAVSCLQTALAKTSQNRLPGEIRDASRIYNSLGLSLVKLNRQPEAEANFRNAAIEDPASPEPYLNLGNLLCHTRPAEAAKLYRKALQCDPWYAQAHNNLGTVLAATAPDEATEHFRRAVSLNPGFADAHNNLGCMLLGSGRVREAVAQFRLALRARPDYPEARQNLERALRRFANPAEAREGPSEK